MYDTLKDRFLRYVKFETRSDEKSETIPSTPTQLEFAKILAKELEEIGMENVYVNDACFVNATLPGNIDKDVPVIGFIAHMDTADFNATNVNPKIVENYDGKDIVLNEAKDIVLSVEEFPNLKNYVGKTVITTDGTTLLGADDKAGIVEIVEAMKYLIEHPEIKHGTVKVAFGPDEEIGRGADNFNVEEFGADFAYTMDGGPVGELEYESFNAAGAVFKIKGKSVHPGTAKGKLINASLIVAEIVNSFPADEVPEKTEGYEGFYFLDKINANCEEAELSYILRDHDREKFEAKKKFAANVAKKINEKYGKELVSVEIKDQYYNMGEIIKDHMNVVEIAKKAMENLGIKPVIEPIRGGTDGSKISFMGLPTPNIFAGGENFHGKYEFVALESMILATDVIVEIVKENNVKSPVIIIIGEVVNLREKMQWFEKKVLSGKNILVTRNKEKQKRVADKINELGGQAVSLPLINIEYNEFEMPDLSQYGAILFNSANSVIGFMNKIKDMRQLANVKIGVVGTKTAEEMENYKIIPDFYPKEYTVERLAAESVKFTNPNEKVLFVVSNISPVYNVKYDKLYGGKYEKGGV